MSPQTFLCFTPSDPEDKRPVVAWTAEDAAEEFASTMYDDWANENPSRNFPMSVRVESPEDGTVKDFEVELEFDPQFFASEIKKDQVTLSELFQQG